MKKWGKKGFVADLGATSRTLCPCCKIMSDMRRISCGEVVRPVVGQYNLSQWPVQLSQEGPQSAICWCGIGKEAQLHLPKTSHIWATMQIPLPWTYAPSQVYTLHHQTAQAWVTLCGVSCLSEQTCSYISELVRNIWGPHRLPSTPAGWCILTLHWMVRCSLYLCAITLLLNLQGWLSLSLIGHCSQPDSFFIWTALHIQQASLAELRTNKAFDLQALLKSL